MNHHWTCPKGYIKSLLVLLAEVQHNHMQNNLSASGCYDKRIRDAMHHNASGKYTLESRAALLILERYLLVLSIKWYHKRLVYKGCISNTQYNIMDKEAAMLP